MAEVDWITWKTDPKEIINPGKIVEEIKEYFQNYDSYMTPMVYEQLLNEVNRGGLAKDAFNVSGISPANEMATDIINTIEEIKHIMKNLQENVKDVADQQKVVEKEQLIEAIKEKIRNEKGFLKDIEEKSQIQADIANSGENVDDVTYIINDRIRKLTERLEQAQSL